MFNFTQKYGEYLDYFNTQLDEYMRSLNDCPDILLEAMSYSLLNGGKRVRPVLCLAAADMLGVNKSEIVNYAMAIEMIHTYSLIHDDLPCMDNDDYRRGKLSCHKKFGEGMAVLAGDALLSLGIETCFYKQKIVMSDINTIKTISKYIGFSGMIAGQTEDVDISDNELLCEDKLYRIYNNKTAKMIILPLLAASEAANKKYYDILLQFGYNLGIMFQITDDILDVEGSLEAIGKTPNKDFAENKYTAVKVFGLNGAKDKAKEHFEKSINFISQLPRSEFLIALTESIYKRKN